MKQLPARFWANVDRTDTCWVWTAGTTAGGYGKAYVDSRQVYAHRAAYESLVGPIPEGAQIDHACHQRLCVNPEHLRPATNQENSWNRAGAQANSKSGVRGVHRLQGKWRVQVKAGGRIHSGGYFTSLAEAEAAAIALRTKLETI